jgi:hypothetical protein
MKSLLIQTLSLCALGTALAASPDHTSNSQQVHLAPAAVMVYTEQTIKVPGNNKATYGPVPKAEQLLDIERLEIAPSPIPVYVHSLLHAMFIN